MLKDEAKVNGFRCVSSSLRDSVTLSYYLARVPGRMDVARLFRAAAPLPAGVPWEGADVEGPFEGLVEVVGAALRRGWWVESSLGECCVGGSSGTLPLCHFVTLPLRDSLAPRLCDFVTS